MGHVEIATCRADQPLLASLVYLPQFDAVSVGSDYFMVAILRSEPIDVANLLADVEVL